MDLKGKVALVTGGASGIGRAYAEELLKNACKVSICDINSDAGDELVQNLLTKYGQEYVIFCQCDVTDYMQFEEAFKTTIATFGSIDIVINNAGLLNDRFWELEVDVNLNGTIRGLLLAFRFMGRDRGGKGGIVINTSSNTCIKPYVSIPIYTATKFAIVGLTRSYGAHLNMVFHIPGRLLEYFVANIVDFEIIGFNITKLIPVYATRLCALDKLKKNKPNQRYRQSNTLTNYQEHLTPC